MDEHTLNDLLECSVCLERLDTSSKVLPCQHTFCRKCLEVIYASRQELRCPECRVLVDTKIEELPPNVLLMRILEGMKNAATKQMHLSNVKNEENNCPSTNTSATTLASSDETSQLHQEQQKQYYQNQQQFQLKQTSQVQLQQNFPLMQNQIPLITAQQISPLQQQRRCIVPHAYALYDFDSNEPSDLKFKKGDLILLRRKIDSNWYVGQSKGSEGNFPVNYVQIVVPLPTSQCVALYDFKMGPNEEEGCLTFKKGTVIQVLRRVDHNWAEGRIGSSIGIFPIAFVELNHLAKQLLESGYIITSNANSSQQVQPTQSYNESARSVPPIPCMDANEVNPSTIAATISTSNPQIITSSSSSSATTSPTSTTTTTNTLTCPSSTNSSSLNTLFHSMPNSPQSSNPSTPQHSAQIAHATSSVRLRNNDLKQKRHSLNALLGNGANALSIMQTNRHSAEILSVPNDFDREAMNTIASAQTTAAREQQHHTSNIPQQHSPQSAQSQAQLQSSSTSTPRHNVLKTCVQQNVTPSLPWGYLALYPYKPRKSDELELKKGCVYMVTERCLDGWFKGKNWKDVSGVFPGNYVTPLRARDQQQLMHSWKLVPPLNCPTTATHGQQQNGSQVVLPKTALQTNPQFASNYSVSMRHDLENINARLTLANLTPHQPMPPDLPPRQLAASPTNVNTSKELRDKEAQKEKPTTTGCMSTSSSASSTSNTVASSASTGLKKFLTHIKSRSKSPGAAIVATAASANANNQNNNNSQGSQQPAQVQLVAQASKQTPMINLNALTPVHVRSGSCPSQLLQTLPNDMLIRGMSGESKSTSQQQPSAANNYGSQRIKGPKERSSLESTRPSIDSTLRSLYANHIQQQSALMPNKCALQYQQQQLALQANASTNIPTTAVVHRKSHSLDASNFIKTSQTQLSNGLTPTTSNSSLAGGAAAAAALKPSMPQCNINAAAIHASATTKSAQNNTSESRFRCVVPYPPNSDVELELQVGDIIFVYRKQKNGWYKGTNSRTYKTGLFPASFVEPDL